jgi:hypothetical protein
MNRRWFLSHLAAGVVITPALIEALSPKPTIFLGSSRTGMDWSVLRGPAWQEPWYYDESFDRMSYLAANEAWNAGCYTITRREQDENFYAMHRPPLGLIRLPT